MPKNVADIIQELPPGRRARVEARATELAAREMTLRNCAWPAR